MAFMSAVYAWPATQSTTVHIKFSQPVSGLPSLVEAQTSATRASTSVVFAPGPRYCTLTVALHWPHILHVDHREIFECAHLKFTVSGRSKQTNKRTSIHTRVVSRKFWSGAKTGVIVYSVPPKNVPPDIIHW